MQQRSECPSKKDLITITTNTTVFDCNGMAQRNTRLAGSSHSANGLNETPLRKQVRLDMKSESNRLHANPTGQNGEGDNSPLGQCGITNQCADTEPKRNRLAGTLGQPISSTKASGNVLHMGSGDEGNKLFKETVKMEYVIRSSPQLELLVVRTAKMVGVTMPPTQSQRPIQLLRLIIRGSN